MSKQAGSKHKTARPMTSAAVPSVNELSLLERVSILASILLSLKQASGGALAADALVADSVAGEATSGDFSPSPDTFGKAFQPLEIARLPETTRAEVQYEPRASSAGTGEHRLAAESNTDPLQALQSAQADAALKPIARHGSSTSPAVLKIEVVDDKVGSAPLSIEKLVPATPVSDIVISPVPATTFLFTGAAGPNNFDIFVGTGRGNTVDFSGLKELAPATNAVQGEAGVVIKQDASAPNGVFVDLSAQGTTVATAAGPVTVQAWQLDADGKAVMPLAHLENIDNVTGTVGNDVVIGNANANTFTYTAADGTHDGQSASYGFDIYYGGPNGAANDPGDTVDFSRLGTQESVAAAPEANATLLPHDAKGITVDLAQAVTISHVDPVSGETSTVTGSLVSTIGGEEQTDLALLAWSAPAEGGAAQATIEDIVGTGGSDLVLGDAAANTYVAVGGGENGVSVFDGRAGTDTVDFSHVVPASDAPSSGAVAAASTPQDVSAPADGVTPPAASDVVVPNGVYVNLSAHEHTAESSSGEVTVQAWTIGSDGTAGTALAHLENVETVVGTVGSDILVGNAEANTFVYTAADDATIDAAGQISTGPGASYGFDIYFGNDAASNSAGDSHDTADFSALGSQASVTAALAEGVDSTLLPSGATGIMVDLAQSVSVTTVDPQTGDLTTVAGSLVTTVGGSEATDLALLAWTAPQDGSDAHSSIENIVTSGGSDAIWGDAGENTVIVTGDGEGGPIYFDGRGSTDTVDFSQLELTGTNSGIEIHLNQTTDGVTDPTGAPQSDVTQVTLLGAQGSTPEDPVVAQVKDVENVVGSCGNDIIEGNANDNVLSGGGGSDSFVFRDVAVVDGRGITDIGHDIIRDFRSGGIDDDDHLVFDSKIFSFHDGSSLDWLQQLLNNNQIRDDDQGVIIWIDENNSITLQNYDLDDTSGHGLGLAAYSSWIVFV
jgi:RTX calcium-binding nonapeptide repeat (4 copies)